jgi:Nitric oxide synthase, oxygenase domain
MICYGNLRRLSISSPSAEMGFMRTHVVHGAPIASRSGEPSLTQQVDPAAAEQVAAESFAHLREATNGGAGATCGATGRWSSSTWPCCIHSTADWSWIVPPICGAATPVFHRYYDAADLRPNYVHHPSNAPS